MSQPLAFPVRPMRQYHNADITTPHREHSRFNNNKSPTQSMAKQQMPFSSTLPNLQCPLDTQTTIMLHHLPESETRYHDPKSVFFLGTVSANLDLLFPFVVFRSLHAKCYGPPLELGLPLKQCSSKHFRSCGILEGRQRIDHVRSIEREGRHHLLVHKEITPEVCAMQQNKYHHGKQAARGSLMVQNAPSPQHRHDLMIETLWDFFVQTGFDPLLIIFQLSSLKSEDYNSK